MTLREIVAKWLHATYSRWPVAGAARDIKARAWEGLSEKSKAKWRADAGELLGMLGEDPDAERG